MFLQFQKQCTENPASQHCNAMVRFTERDVWPWEDTYTKESFLTLSGQLLAWDTIFTGLLGSASSPSLDNNFALIRVGDDVRISMRVNDVQGYNGLNWKLSDSHRPTITSENIIVGNFTTTAAKMSPLLDAGFDSLLQMVGGGRSFSQIFGGSDSNVGCARAKQLLPHIIALDEAYFAYGTATVTWFFVWDHHERLFKHLKKMEYITADARMDDGDLWQTLIDYHIAEAENEASVFTDPESYTPFNTQYTDAIATMVLGLATKPPAPSQLNIQTQATKDLQGKIVVPLQKAMTSTENPIWRDALIDRTDAADSNTIEQVDPWIAIRALTKHAKEAAEEVCKAEEAEKWNKKFYDENVETIQFAADVIDSDLGAAFRFFRLLTEE